MTCIDLSYVFKHRRVYRRCSDLGWIGNIIIQQSQQQLLFFEDDSAITEAIGRCA